MSALRSQRGFTVIELMITLIIAAILLAVGVPSYRATLQNARSSALSSDLTSAINLARAEAVRRGQPVSVCPSANMSTCGGAWTAGWIVIVDTGSEVLRIWATPPADSLITQTPTANSELEFGPLGELVSGNTALVAEMAGCAGPRARTLDLAASGRVSVSRTDCS